MSNPVDLSKPGEMTPADGLWMAVLAAVQLLNAAMQAAAKVGVDARLGVTSTSDGFGSIQTITAERVTWMT